MSEETTKEKMGELCGKMAQLIEKMADVEVDKNSDKLIEATREFSLATDEFTKKLENIDSKFKAYINFGVIIDVSFTGESKLRVVCGGKKHITEVLDELKELVEK